MPSCVAALLFLLVDDFATAQPTFTPIQTFTPVLNFTPIHTFTPVSFDSPTPTPTSTPTSTTASALCDPSQYGADHSSTDPETGHCYLGYDVAVTWFGAEASCREIGGYLAVIDSEPENLIARLAIPASTQSPWIGFNDLDAEAGKDPFKFVKVTGGYLTFNGFLPGEPNSSGDEDCVHYLTEINQYAWNDFPCSRTQFFICELTATPCGNGVINPGEDCDDGNAADGDGCEADCAHPSTATVTATFTDTSTPTPSVTPTPSATATATSTDTSTLTPTVTDTVTPTATDSPTPTATSTETTTSTATVTWTTTPTATASASVTATETPTVTSTTTPTETWTATITASATATPTVTPTPTATAIPSHTSTSTRTPIQCVGDCNGNLRVTVDELIRGVNAALGLLAVSSCPAVDRNSDDDVGIFELINAVNNALDGCRLPPA